MTSARLPPRDFIAADKYHIFDAPARGHARRLFIFFRQSGSSAGLAESARPYSCLFVAASPTEEANNELTAPFLGDGASHIARFDEDDYSLLLQLVPEHFPDRNAVKTYTVKHRMTGVCEAYALLGFVRFLHDFHLFAVTNAEEAAMIGTHPVYGVRSTKLILLNEDGRNQETMTRVSNRIEDLWSEEYKLKDAFLGVRPSAFCYCNSGLDLSRTIQSSCLVNDAKPRKKYQWNNLYCEKFEHALPILKEQKVFTRMIFGDVIQRRITLASHSHAHAHQHQPQQQQQHYHATTTAFSSSATTPRASGAGSSSPQMNNNNNSNKKFLSSTFSSTTHHHHHADDPHHHTHHNQAYSSHQHIPQNNTNLISSMSFQFSMITRRSRHFAGVRYLKRGITEEGRAANHVEIEQLLIDESSDMNNPALSSYCQVRCSVPVLWYHENVSAPKPPIYFGANDSNFTSTRNHFTELIEDFGTPCLVFNLMQHNEKKAREEPLSDLFYKAICTITNSCLSTNDKQENETNDKTGEDEHINTTSNSGSDNNNNKKQQTSSCSSSSPPIIYHEYDFRKNVRMAWNVITAFGEKSLNTTNSFTLRNGTATSIQRGVIRTNCVDCIDRTNVAQCFFATHIVEHQLLNLAATARPVSNVSTVQLRSMMLDMFQILGDNVAQDYCGSETVSAGIDTGRGILWDKAMGVKRFYANKFSDDERQMSINYFLGLYKMNLRRSVTLTKCVCGRSATFDGEDGNPTDDVVRMGVDSYHDDPTALAHDATYYASKWKSSAPNVVPIIGVRSLVPKEGQNENNKPTTVVVSKTTYCLACSPKQLQRVQEDTGFFTSVKNFFSKTSNDEYEAGRLKRTTCDALVRPSKLEEVDEEDDYYLHIKRFRKAPNLNSKLSVDTAEDSNGDNNSSTSNTTNVKANNKKIDPGVPPNWWILPLQRFEESNPTTTTTNNNKNTNATSLASNKNNSASSAIIKSSNSNLLVSVTKEQEMITRITYSRSSAAWVAKMRPMTEVRIDTEQVLNLSNSLERFESLCDKVSGCSVNNNTSLSSSISPSSNNNKDEVKLEDFDEETQQQLSLLSSLFLVLPDESRDPHVHSAPHFANMTRLHRDPCLLVTNPQKYVTDLFDNSPAMKQEQYWYGYDYYNLDQDCKMIKQHQHKQNSSVKKHTRGSKANNENLSRLDNKDLSVLLRPDDDEDTMFAVMSDEKMQHQQSNLFSAVAQQDIFADFDTQHEICHFMNTIEALGPLNEVNCRKMIESFNDWELNTRRQLLVAPTKSNNNNHNTKNELNKSSSSSSVNNSVLSEKAIQIVLDLLFIYRIPKYVLNHLASINVRGAFLSRNKFRNNNNTNISGRSKHSNSDNHNNNQPTLLAANPYVAMAEAMKAQNNHNNNYNNHKTKHSSSSPPENNHHQGGNNNNNDPSSQHQQESGSSSTAAADHQEPLFLSMIPEYTNQRSFLSASSEMVQMLMKLKDSEKVALKRWALLVQQIKTPLSEQEAEDMIMAPMVRGWESSETFFHELVDQKSSSFNVNGDINNKNAIRYYNYHIKNQSLNQNVAASTSLMNIYLSQQRHQSGLAGGGGHQHQHGYRHHNNNNTNNNGLFGGKYNNRSNNNNNRNHQQYQNNQHNQNQETNNDYEMSPSMLRMVGQDDFTTMMTHVPTESLWDDPTTLRNHPLTFFMQKQPSSRHEFFSTIQSWVGLAARPTNCGGVPRYHRTRYEYDLTAKKAQKLPPGEILVCVFSLEELADWMISSVASTTTNNSSSSCCFSFQRGFPTRSVFTPLFNELTDCPPRVSAAVLRQQPVPLIKKAARELAALWVQYHLVIPVFGDEMLKSPVPTSTLVTDPQQLFTLEQFDVAIHQQDISSKSFRRLHHLQQYYEQYQVCVPVLEAFLSTTSPFDNDAVSLLAEFDQQRANAKRRMELHGRGVIVDAEDEEEEIENQIVAVEQYVADSKLAKDGNNNSNSAAAPSPIGGNNKYTNIDNEEEALLFGSDNDDDTQNYVTSSSQQLLGNNNNNDNNDNNGELPIAGVTPRNDQIHHEHHHDKNDSNNSAMMMSPRAAYKNSCINTIANYAEGQARVSCVVWSYTSADKYLKNEMESKIDDLPRLSAASLEFLDPTARCVVLVNTFNAIYALVTSKLLSNTIINSKDKEVPAFSMKSWAAGRLLRRYGFSFGGVYFSLSDIKHGLLRGNKAPPGHVLPPFGLDDMTKKMSDDKNDNNNNNNNQQQKQTMMMHKKRMLIPSVVHQDPRWVLLLADILVDSASIDTEDAEATAASIAHSSNNSNVAVLNQNNTSSNSNGMPATSGRNYYSSSGENNNNNNNYNNNNEEDDGEGFAPVVSTGEHLSGGGPSYAGHHFHHTGKGATTTKKSHQNAVSFASILTNLWSGGGVNARGGGKGEDDDDNDEEDGNNNNNMLNSAKNNVSLECQAVDVDQADRLLHTQTEKVYRLLTRNHYSSKIDPNQHVYVQPPQPSPQAERVMKHLVSMCEFSGVDPDSSHRHKLHTNELQRNVMSTLEDLIKQHSPTTSRQ